MDTAWAFVGLQMDCDAGPLLDFDWTYSGLRWCPYWMASRPPQGDEATPQQGPNHSTSNRKPTLHQRARSAQYMGTPQPKRHRSAAKRLHKASVSTLLNYFKRLFKRARCIKRVFREYFLFCAPCCPRSRGLHFTHAASHQREGMPAKPRTEACYLVICH